MKNIVNTNDLTERSVENVLVNTRIAPVTFATKNNHTDVPIEVNYETDSDTFITNYYQPKRATNQSLFQKFYSCQSHLNILDRDIYELKRVKSIYFSEFGKRNFIVEKNHNLFRTIL